MENNSLNSIFSLLPEKVIVDAACRYVVYLTHDNQMEAAENLYRELCALESRFDSLAEAAVSLLVRHLARKEINQALTLYENFPICEERYACLAEKLKACHALVFALLPECFTKAHEIWVDCRIHALNPALKWQWVETGVALLEACYKSGSMEKATEIFQYMNEYGESMETRSLLNRARQIMRKINR